MSRQIRRSPFSASLQSRAEQSGVAKRSHRPQPLVKKSPGSEIIAMVRYRQKCASAAERGVQPQTKIVGFVSSATSRVALGQADRTAGRKARGRTRRLPRGEDCCWEIATCRAIGNRLMTSLFDPIRLGDLDLPNRLIMAPLTRMRAKPDDRTPTALMAEQYVQRASAGLILTEATSGRSPGRRLSRHARHLVARTGRGLEAGHRRRARRRRADRHAALACRAHFRSGAAGRARAGLGQCDRGGRPYQPCAAQAAVSSAASTRDA